MSKRTHARKPRNSAQWELDLWNAWPDDWCVWIGNGPQPAHLYKIGQLKALHAWLGKVIRWLEEREG